MWSFYETMQRSVQCWFIGMCAGINTYVQRQDTIGIWGCNLSNNYAMENDVHDKVHGANLDSWCVITSFMIVIVDPGI